MPNDMLSERAQAAFLHLCELEPKITSADWPKIRQVGLECVMRVISEKDCSYLPNFKWMDFVSVAVTLTRSIAQETQLKCNEASGLLRNLLSDTAESVRRLRLEASLERARYEPMMVQQTHIKKWGSERKATLHMRWELMKAAQQAHYEIPPLYMQHVEQAVEQAIRSTAFRNYRVGPTLQLFAEMLHIARGATTEGESEKALKRALSPNGTLWRSYVLKAQRYKKKPPSVGDASGANASTIH